MCRDSSVVIATRNELDGPRTREGKIFRTRPDPAQPYSFTMGTGSLSRGQSGRGVTTTHPHLAPRLKKG